MKDEAEEPLGTATEGSTARTTDLPGEFGPAREFHSHLDICARCEGQPFNLCPIGARLIQKAVAA